MSETKQLPTYTRNGVTVYLTVREEDERGTVTNGEDADTEDIAAVLAALPLDAIPPIVQGLDDAHTQALAAAIDWPDEREEYERARKDLYRQAVEAESRASKLESELSAEREAHAATRLALWNAAPPSPPPAEATGGRRTERGHLYPSPSEPGLDCLHCGCNYFSRESTLTCTGRAPTEETAGKDGRE